MRILNIGACSIAYVYGVSHITRQGETISANSIGQFPSGKGLEQSIALAREGAEVYHAGCIGEDGIFLKDFMGKFGVHTEYMRVVPEKTGHEIIQVDKNGQNGCLIYQGANKMIDKQYIVSVLGHFGMGDYLILQNEIDHISYIVDCAYDRGIKVVLNPSSYNEQIEAVDFRKLSWLLLTEEEAKKLTKIENAMEAINMLKKTYPNMEIVISSDDQGCFYTCGDKVQVQGASDASEQEPFVKCFLSGGTTPYSQMQEINQNGLLSRDFSKAVSRKEEMVMLIEKCIEENLKQITLRDLAEKMNYSSAYTSRWIRQNMHTSYNELVQKKRCAVAAKLLQSTDMPVGEIIAYVGYNNESFFRNKFSSIYGKKPSQFREDHKK